MLAKVQAAATSHPNYKQGPKAESGSRLHFVFGNPTDMGREIAITVLAFDIPDGRKSAGKHESDWGIAASLPPI